MQLNNPAGTISAKNYRLTSMYVFHLLKQELHRITLEIKCPLETIKS